MPTHDEALLEAAEHLLEPPEGQRGRLSPARVRRSVSTVYYAIFHFLLDEIGQKVIGADGDLLARRRILERTISHKGLKTALDKVRGKLSTSPLRTSSSLSALRLALLRRRALSGTSQMPSSTLGTSGSRPITT